MTVYLAHAPADTDAAEALEKVIERRGQFVELDDGQTAMRPIQASDVFVLLVSQALLFATARLRLEQRALDAWADGRLILVKLDNGIAPVGLRDLPAIDASFEAQREFRWNEVADAIREKVRASLPSPPESEGGIYGRVRSKLRNDDDDSRPNWWLRLVLLIPGLWALAVSGAIWLANRIGPTPGGLPELRQGIDAYGVRNWFPPGVTEWVFVAAIVLMLAVIVTSIAKLARRPATRSEAPASDFEQAPASAPAPKQTDTVFVSYARANQDEVLPVIDGAAKAGRKFWVDQQGIEAGDGWAGEIVRAIRSAGGVVVMCSKAAFESDHVKREIYLADRYSKKLVPVFIEQAEPPEDFEYFFAGVQVLKLFETPEAERPAAFMRVLG
jgi:TIR domain